MMATLLAGIPYSLPLLAYCEISRMFCTRSVPGLLFQKFAGALGCAFINFRTLRSASNLPRCYTGLRSLLLDQLQSFGAPLTDSDWPMDVESTRNRLEMPLHCFCISVPSVARRWIQVHTSVPEGFGQFPHFLRESGLRTLWSMCCLPWSRLEIWIFDVLLVSDSLLLCVSVSPEEYRNNGLHWEMFERSGSLRLRTAGVHGWLEVAAIETAVSKQTSSLPQRANFNIITLTSGERDVPFWLVVYGRYYLLPLGPPHGFSLCSNLFQGKSLQRHTCIGCPLSLFTYATENSVRSDGGRAPRARKQAKQRIHILRQEHMRNFTLILHDSRPRIFRSFLVLELPEEYRD